MEATSWNLTKCRVRAHIYFTGFDRTCVTAEVIGKVLDKVLNDPSHPWLVSEGGKQKPAVVYRTYQGRMNEPHNLVKDNGQHHWILHLDRPLKPTVWYAFNRYIAGVIKRLTDHEIGDVVQVSGNIEIDGPHHRQNTPAFEKLHPRS